MFAIFRHSSRELTFTIFLLAAHFFQQKIAFSLKSTNVITQFYLSLLIQLLAKLEVQNDHRVENQIGETTYRSKLKMGKLDRLIILLLLAIK